MVLKITKETWKKCGIKRIKYYNKKEDDIMIQKETSIAKKNNKTFP